MPLLALPPSPRYRLPAGCCCADEDVSLVLVSYPDLFAQLALTLQRLFTDFAVAGWVDEGGMGRRGAGVLR